MIQLPEPEHDRMRAIVRAAEARMPKRIQLQRTPGWRKPETAIVVSRPSRYGNPYRAEVYGLDRCLALYANTLDGYWTPTIIADLDDALAHETYRLHCEFGKRFGKLSPAEEALYVLGGFDLCCWCPLSRRCHVDILLPAANPELYRAVMARAALADATPAPQHERAR